MKAFNQMSFIKKIYFSRVAGRDGEHRAAEIITDTIKMLGGEALYEPFELSTFEIKDAGLTAYSNGKQFVFEVTGYGRTGSTNTDGITGPFEYIGTGSNDEIDECEGKIVFVNTMHHDLYRRLTDKKAAAFITFDGSVTDDRTRTDLNTRSIKDKTTAFGELPGITLRASDALKLIKINPETVTVKLIQNNITLTSGNVIADIKGANDTEKMLFTAHYDSTMFSKGAWDNASGCANLMALYSYYKENKPQRSVRFIWCGSEEMGLKGSKAYVERHRDELKEYRFGINIDMTGTVIGNDIACVSGDDSIKSYLQYCAAETGFPVSISSGIFPSDSSSFAHAGIPFVVFQRGGQGGMHNRNDKIDFLSEDSLKRTTEFIRFASERLLNSSRFPIPRTIPERIREELDNYFG